MRMLSRLSVCMELRTLNQGHHLCCVWEDGHTCHPV